MPTPPEPISRPAPTGCIHVCALDADGFCLGCHRHETEICRWPGDLGGSAFSTGSPR